MKSFPWEQLAILRLKNYQAHTCVSPVLFSRCSGDCFCQGTLPKDTLFIFSPYPGKCQSRQDSALPIQVSLNGDGTLFLPQMLWEAHSMSPTLQLSSSDGWQPHFHLKSLLSPYIADFCQHGPLIEHICLFIPCLSKQGRTGSTSHHSPCLLKSGSLLAHTVSSVPVCSGSPGLLFITLTSLSLGYWGTKLCMKTL